MLLGQSPLESAPAQGLRFFPAPQGFHHFDTNVLQAISVPTVCNVDRVEVRERLGHSLMLQESLRNSAIVTQARALEHLGANIELHVALSISNGRKRRVAL